MTVLTCPAEGCGTSKEPAALKKHIYAKADDAHEENEQLIEQVDHLLSQESDGSSSKTSTETEGEQQDDEQEKQEEKAAESAASRGAREDQAEDEQNQEEEQVESSTEGEIEQEESSGSSTGMPTQEEYERMTGGSSSESSTVNHSKEDDDQERISDLPTPSLPVDTFTLAMVAGLVLLTLLAWMWLRSGDGQQPVEQVDVDVDDVEEQAGQDSAAVDPELIE